MKECVSVIMIALCVFFASAFSVNAQLSNIASVDGRKVLVQSVKGSEARKELLQEKEKMRKELERKRSDKDYEVLREDYAAKLKDKDNEFIRTMSKEIKEVIKGVGTRDGYALIVEKENCIYFMSPAIDITDITEEVLKEYNAFTEAQAKRIPTRDRPAASATTGSAKEQEALSSNKRGDGFIVKGSLEGYGISGIEIHVLPAVVQGKEISVVFSAEVFSCHTNSEGIFEIPVNSASQGSYVLGVPKPSGSPLSRGVEFNYLRNSNGAIIVFSITKDAKTKIIDLGKIKYTP